MSRFKKRFEQFEWWLLNLPYGIGVPIGIVLIIAFSLTVSLIVCFIFGWYPVRAQDNPPIYTQFEVGCIERLGDIHYRIHFGYESDGIEDFTVEFTNPNEGTAFINTPSSFSTSPGEHDDWYLDAHSEDSGYIFEVLFTSDAGSHTLALYTWNLLECAEDQYTVYVPVTPEPVVGNCPAWSYESATGNVICLWDLPYVGDWQ